MNSFKSLDNISRMFLFQASSKNSVVSEEKLSKLQKEIYIETKLDDFLLEYCKKSYNDSETKLIILSGNAGDGKSMMLNQLKNKMEKTNIPKDYWVVNSDATHTDTKTQKLDNKLFDFFNRFIKDYENKNPKIYLIAMNIGIAIRYFNSDKYKNLDDENNHKLLKKFIFNELNIKVGKNLKNNLSDNILIVNFDLRCIVQPNLDFIDNNGDSFFKDMLDKVISLFNFNKCEHDNCIGENCPVYMNMKFLKKPQIQKKLENILYKVFLYDKVHLTPRNIWDFLYYIITGGENIYIKINKDKNVVEPCYIIFNSIDEKHYNKFLFFNNLFDNNSENSILKYIQKEIQRFDPLFINNRELELNKILVSSNSKLIENNILKDKIKILDFDKKYNNLIFNDYIKKDLELLIKNLSRLSYFFDDYFTDILLQNSTLTNIEENFKQFHETLKKQKEYIITSDDEIEVDVDLRKKISEVLISTFGSKGKDDEDLMQIDTIQNRSNGKLLSQLQVVIDKKLAKEFYPYNKKILEVIDYFPNKFIIRINNMRLKVSLDLYELFNLASNGYNISSIDLERFKQIEILNNKILPNSKNYNNVYFEYDNNLAVFRQASYEIELKRISQEEF